MALLLKQVDGNFNDAELDGIGMTLEGSLGSMGRKLCVAWNETAKQFEITAYKNTSIGQDEHELEPNKTDQRAVARYLKTMPVMARCFEMVGTA